MPKEQPWNPTDATQEIRELAKGADWRLSLTEHAEVRMDQRDLIVRDVIHVLQNGFVYDEAKTSSRPGSFKYKMQSATPNSANRQVRVVAIPDPRSGEIKIVTVMWADEGS
jgi:hypothetical protein